MNVFNKESRYYPFAILLAIAIAALVLRGTGCVSAPVTPSGSLSSAPHAEPVTDSCCAMAWGMKDGPVHHVARGTSYYPDPSPMEGGYLDAYGDRLRTLQGFLAGRDEYVSVAYDQKSFGKVKRKICIPELNASYGKPIKFLISDTGGRFYGKGWTKLDVCTANKATSLDKRINQALTVVECK